MTDMREMVASKAEAILFRRLVEQRLEGYTIAASLEIANAIQPEIDRRVAEERAKLLEQLREVARQFHYHGYWDGQAALFPEGEDCQKNFEEYADLLAQFEKENSDG